MSVMYTSRPIDDKALFRLLDNRGGECSFEDAVGAFRSQGITDDDARDEIWRLLSHGQLVFTPDRHLTKPGSSAVSNSQSRAL